MNTIGTRIRELRNKNKMTLDDLALKLLTSKQTIQRYETGIIQNIPSDKIEAIAKALDTTPAYLMGWDIPEPKHKEFGDHLANLEYLRDKSDNLAIYKDICESDGLRILFDKARSLEPEDIEMITSLIDKFKKEID